MNFRNLTPHSVSVYSEAQFLGLEDKGNGTLLADGVNGDPILELASEGAARISTTTEVQGHCIDGIPLVATRYGDAVGIPADVSPSDTLIVSLPMQSMAKAAGHPLAGQMAAPYKVVRDRANPSTVLGCIGFTK